jgi:glycosyltransferase involved in cell wall biosynthesis
VNPRRCLVCSYAAPAADRDSGSRRLQDLVGFLQEAGCEVAFASTNAAHPSRERAFRQRGIAVFESNSLPELLAAGRFDLLLAAFWPVAEYVLPMVRRLAPATRVMVDSVDLHYLRHARGILADADHLGDRGTLDEGYAAQLVGELNVYAAADLVLTVSQTETDRLKDWLGRRTPVICVPDCEDWPASPIARAERRGMLSLGSYEHPPNVQAVEYLCREIVPRLDPELLAAHPVYVVGNALNERTRSYAEGLPYVRMVGWVPSAAEYFYRSRISVVPLLYGAGTKRKMVQALMSETPTVATSTGAEGMNLRDEEHVLIADTPEAFADAIKRLISDEALWMRLARNGRDHILQSHNRDFAKARFQQAVELLLQQQPKPPLLVEDGRDRYDQRLQYQRDQQTTATRAQARAREAYRKLAARIQGLLSRAIPPNARLLVISKGDGDLLAAHSGPAGHFPQGEDGGYVGHHPADDSVAIRHLELLRQQGAEFLLVPEPSFWWLDFYREFAAHVRQFAVAGEQRDAGIVFDLRAVTNGSGSNRAQHDVARLDMGLSAPGLPSMTAAPIPERNETFPARLIAFYLPQFHPIPENDVWWGDGFTEWTNVTKAKPLFPGHYQPHLPADLGYYDLRLAEAREAQATLARSHGIYGFCYYHYWFDGKMLLERPFNEVLASGKPDFPFCLCWANEPWSRRWDGRPTDVLQPQTYSARDDEAHIRWLLPALADRRAIQVDGKPLLLIYQGRDLPDPARTAATWRREVEKAGLVGLHLVAVETGWDAEWDATQAGFDAKALFQPQFSMLGTVRRQALGSKRLRVFDYQEAWPVLANPEPVSYLRYDTVFPAWDNTARRGEEGWVVHNASPEAYEQWLRLVLERTQERPPNKRIVFLNAWNEWAEGCHLEPDQRSGRMFLEATLRALRSTGQACGERAFSAAKRTPAAGRIE